MVAQIVILVCWIVFLTYWLLSALSTKRTVERQNVTAGLKYRIPLTLGALLLLRLVPASAWNPRVILPTPATHALAASLCILGLLGAIWARRTLAKNWSMEVVFKEQHELIERGPYRFVRHPIYTSILLMLLGATLMAGYLASLVGFLLFIVGFYVKLRQEETLMLKHFPTQYTIYKSRVKTLLPFVW